MFFSDLQNAINISMTSKGSIVVKVVDTYGDTEYAVMTIDEYFYVLPMLNDKSKIVSHKIVFREKDKKKFE